MAALNSTMPADSYSDSDDSDVDELLEATQCLLTFPCDDGSSSPPGPVANSKRFAKLIVRAVLDNDPPEKLSRVMDVFMQIEQDERRTSTLTDVYHLIRRSPGLLDFIKVLSNYEVGRETLYYLAVWENAKRYAFEQARFDVLELLSEYQSGRSEWSMEGVLALPDFDFGGYNAAEREMARGMQKAALQGDADALKALWAKAGSDGSIRMELTLRACDLKGRTPLSYSCREGHEKAVEFLLELYGGAYRDEYDNWGHTPLEWAVLRGHRGVVKQLLKAGANIYYKSVGGGIQATILAEATLARDTSIVRLLLEHLSTTEKTSSRNEVVCNAIKAAASRGYVEILTLLLQSGLAFFDELSKERQYLTLLDASSYGYRRVLRLLLETGCDVPLDMIQFGGDGQNVLREALLHGSRKCVRELLMRKSSDLYSAKLPQVLCVPPKLLRSCAGWGFWWEVKLLLRAGVRDSPKGDTMSAESGYGGGHDEFSAADLACIAGNNAIANYIRSFQMSLADRCLCVIRRALAPPMRKTARRLPLPSSSIDKVLF